jgi:hypothetical protein
MLCLNTKIFSSALYLCHFSTICYDLKISGSARRIHWQLHTIYFQEYIMDTRSNKFLALFSDPHLSLSPFTSVVTEIVCTAHRS